VILLSVALLCLRRIGLVVRLSAVPLALPCLLSVVAAAQAAGQIVVLLAVIPVELPVVLPVVLPVDVVSWKVKIVGGRDPECA
jgi:hypothetical protein